MNVGRFGTIASWQITLGVALLALGFLIAAQLRTEAPRVRYASQERVPLVETARGLQTQQDGLKQRLLDLRAQIQSLESQGQGSAALVRDLEDRLRQARIAAGLIALQGSGLVLQLGDSSNVVPPGDNPTDYLVSARDIRTVVEELWLAGAEAVAVNGERVASTSAIIDIGGSISSTPPTWRRPTRSRRSARPTCSTRSTARPASASSSGCGSSRSAFR